MSQNYDFLTLNREFVSCNYEKKSQNCEIFFIQWRKRSFIIIIGTKTYTKILNIYLSKHLTHNLYKNV